MGWGSSSERKMRMSCWRLFYRMYQYRENQAREARKVYQDPQVTWAYLVQWGLWVPVGCQDLWENKAALVQLVQWAALETVEVLDHRE